MGPICLPQCFRESSPGVLRGALQGALRGEGDWVSGLWEWCRSPFPSLGHVQQVSRCKVIFNWIPSVGLQGAAAVPCDQLSAHLELLLGPQEDTSVQLCHLLRREASVMEKVLSTPNSSQKDTEIKSNVSDWRPRALWPNFVWWWWCSRAHAQWSRYSSHLSCVRECWTLEMWLVCVCVWGGTFYI